MNKKIIVIVLSAIMQSVYSMDDSQLALPSEQNLKEPTAIRSLFGFLAVSPDSSSFIISKNKSLCIKDKSSKKKQIAFLPEDPIRAVALSPNAKYVALRCADYIKIFDSESNKEVAKITQYMDGTPLLFLNNQELLIAELDGIKKLKFLEEQQSTDFITHYGADKIICLVDNAIVFTNFSNESKPVIKIADSTGIITKRLKVHKGGNVHCLSSHAATHRVASACADHSVRIWNIKKDEIDACVAKLIHSNNVMSVAFNLSGNNVITGTDEAEVMVWDIPAQMELSKKIVLKNPTMKYVFEQSSPITFLSWAGNSIVAQNKVGNVYEFQV